MTRDETIAHWKKCEGVRAASLQDGKSDREAHDDAKTVWNSWAAALLTERSELVKSGLWAAKIFEKGTYAAREYGESNETNQWLERAACDFSGFRFEPVSSAETEASERTFLHKKDFDWFGSDMRRSSSFSGYIFPSDCDFWATSFAGPVSFDGAVFHGFGGFRRCNFKSVVWFNGATFKRTAWFARTLFSSVTDFRDVTFCEWARFAGAKFEEVALFEEAQFKKRTWFRGCSFAQRASFDGSKFEAEADFSGISVEHAFDMRGVSFLEPPGFRQSKQTPLT